MKTPDAEMAPRDIERRSFEIISEEMRALGLDVADDIAPVVKRVIHTSADFDYARTLCFSEDAVGKGVAALRDGCPIVTDTRMAMAGINGGALRAAGSEVHCHIADDDVAETARERGCTRSRAAVEKSACLRPEAIYAVGNAPTALIRICELIQEGRLRPRLVIGAPVGFVNVVESKELLLRCNVPHIVARGRKGGSNVAAAICNALLYLL